MKTEAVMCMALTDRYKLSIIARHDFTFSKNGNKHLVLFYKKVPENRPGEITFDGPLINCATCWCDQRKSGAVSDA